MKKIIGASLLLFAAVAAFAQNTWSDAVYAVLTGPASDTARVLYYLDADGNVLGSQSMQTSDYATASAIAYGASVCPNLGTDENGLLLLRTQAGTATYAAQSNYRTINFYGDPLNSSGGTLARISAATYGAFNLNPSLAAGKIDHYIDLAAGKDGRVYALINRTDESSGSIVSLLYAFSMPDTAASNVTINRDHLSDTVTFGYFDISTSEADKVATDFAFGSFYNSQIGDQQFAVILADGTLQVRALTYSAGGTSLLTSFDVSRGGKDILSMWESDYGLIAVLYDDNSVSEWNANTGQIENTFSFSNTLSNILDVARLAPVAVPEPAEVAALFGLLALWLVARRRK